MEKPIALAAAGIDTIHISTGVSPRTGFRQSAVCGLTTQDFQSLCPVAELPDEEVDQLCADCVRGWANTSDAA